MYIYIYNCTYVYTCVYLHDYHSMEVSAHCTLLLIDA